MDCPTNADQLFGPRIDANCRTFDFTLQFEDTIFACLPPAVFLIIVGPALYVLLRCGPLRPVRSWLLISKTASLIGALVFQLVLLGYRVRHDWTATNASLPADILGVTAVMLALPLSVLTHLRSTRPSTVLGLFLSVSLLFGAARLRTFWIVAQTENDNRSAISFTCYFSFLATALAFESLQARIAPQSSTEDSALGHCAAPELYAGLWSRTSFAWLGSTFRKGYVGILSPCDIPALDPQLSSAAMRPVLENSWKQSSRLDRHALVKACFRSYWLAATVAIIPRLFVTTFTFMLPFLISATLNYLEATPLDQGSYGKGLIGAWALAYIALAISNSIFQYQTFRFVTRVRGGLMGLIYQATLETTSADMGVITATALIGTDVERIVGGLRAFNDTWASLLEVGIASWLLARQVSLACLAPIVLVLGFIALSSKVSGTLGPKQRLWMDKVQGRLRITSATLGDMKAVKMLGLSRSLQQSIQNSRTDEIETSRSFRKSLVLLILLSLTPINLAPVVTFTVYVIIATYWKSQTLLPAQAFTSLALISLLTTPVIVFIQSLPQVLKCVGNFDRIQEYCNYRYKTCHDKIGNYDQAGAAILLADDVPLQTQASKVISLEGRQYVLNSPTPQKIRFPDVRIERGSLVAVTGPVGSGKSTFLHALIGELHSTAVQPRLDAAALSQLPGHVIAPLQGESMAYCSEQPWIENGTIRHNIVGSEPWEDKRYDAVLATCCLAHDLDHLSGGDQFQVGSKGTNLSGGQKQRIALARALYARRKILLLDGVFSGMDNSTAKAVLRNILASRSSESPNTMFLTTHDYQVITIADTLIVFDHEGETAAGSLQTLLSNNNKYLKMLEALAQAPVEAEQQVSGKYDAETPQPQSSDNSTAEQHGLRETSNEQQEAAVTDARRKNGDWSVYSYYMKSAGVRPIVLYGITVALWIFCTEFSTIWINWWSEANTAQPARQTGMYLGVYVMFGVIGVLGAAFAAWFAYISVISNSALKLHTDLLKVTLQAPYSFFSKTDNGETLNRFSEDMELIDMDLPGTALNYTSTALSCFAQLIIAAIFSRTLAAALPLILSLLYLLQRFYLRTSRQMRHLMIEAKAPLYTLITETETPPGAMTIRAFGWKPAYAQKASNLIDASQRPAYMQACIQYWLTFVLNMTTAVLAVILIATVVTWSDQLNVSAGGVGVALIMIIGLSETMTRLVTSWTKMESSVGAVARVKRFMEDVESEDVGDYWDGNGHGNGYGNEGSAERVWTRPGEVVLRDVTAAYSPNSNAILKDITLQIDPGQHIAICGRTGSGKTSLILSLLRMLSIQSGEITLEGNTITDHGTPTGITAADEIRSRFNVVSQDPFIVPGTSVRWNLDPYYEAPAAGGVGGGGGSSGGDSQAEAAKDQSMIAALEQVGLWHTIREAGGLGTCVDGLHLSTGQKQLLCFARAIIRRTKCGILMLDEATGSLDAEADAKVQNIIDTTFRGCTVLAVTHRLTHVDKYDQIAFMDDGRLAELGSLKELLARNGGFARLYKGDKGE